MKKTAFEKHPVLTLSIFVLAILCVIALMAEIILRYTLPYNVGYYSAVLKDGVYHYPYGDIQINKDTFPDKPFDLSSKKERIGYFGDSIIMGVGAGDGYRISDLLERQYPAYEHWTYGMMGNGLREYDLWELIDRYKLNKIVYGLNLNDLLPITKPADGQPIAGEKQSFVEKSLQRIEIFLRLNVDWLRGKSYLYTATRTAIKNIFQAAGYGYTGFKAVEFYPHENEDIIRDLALRLNAVAEELDRRNIDFCFIIFPYEMQISKVAAQTYRDRGIDWEDGFEKGSTQEIFKKYLKLPHLYDARDAFKGYDTAPAGQYFVYNKGDKIDFNHPNRAGHALIMEGLIASKTCNF